MRKQKIGVVGRNFARKKYNWGKDKKFLKELDRRAEELESNKVKGLTLDELERGISQRIKSK